MAGQLMNTKIIGALLNLCSCSALGNYMFWKMVKFFVLLPFALVAAYLIFMGGMALLVMLFSIVGK